MYCLTGILWVSAIVPDGWDMDNDTAWTGGSDNGKYFSNSVSYLNTAQTLGLLLSLLKNRI